MDYLGLSAEGLNMGRVAASSLPMAGRRSTRHPRCHAPHDSVISVAISDGIEQAYEEAKRRRFEIVHPLTTEPWAYSDSSFARQTAT